MKKNDPDRQILRALGLMTQLGLSMAVSVAIGVLLGHWLDGKLGTSPWLLILGCVIGAASAFNVLYDYVIKDWMK